jgi:hypothetical protein
MENGDFTCKNGVLSDEKVISGISHARMVILHAHLS